MGTEPVVVVLVGVLLGGSSRSNNVDKKQSKTKQRLFFCKEQNLITMLLWLSKNYLPQSSNTYLPCACTSHSTRRPRQA